MLEDFSSNVKGKRTETYTILFLELKTLNVLWNNNSNSCHDVAVLTARGTTFGTSFELDGSLLYVVPTGRVIATVSIKVPTGRYIVPADYIVLTGRTN
ncbi:hypothetical protein Tco_1009060 [Tanacetum coccineum]